MSHNVIIDVEENSIAAELGVRPGDCLIAINNKVVKDVFDYRYLIADAYIEVIIKTRNGEDWLLEIEKDDDEDLGLVFESGLMDKAKSCGNKCVFCFIDQLPKGMRESLYFKDDDSRLSFLSGNYVTLTNMTGKDLERIIFYKLSPINISVHATEPELRAGMLNNKKAGQILTFIQKLHDAGIHMNFQVVLCRGVNDGVHLDKTIEDLSRFMPLAKSLSIVPVGLTRHRKANGLPDLTGFDRESSRLVLEQIRGWNKKFLEEHNTAFVYPADEFFIMAEEDFPGTAYYEDFPQLENGVGMAALFQKEFNDMLKTVLPVNYRLQCTVVTGAAAYNVIKRLADNLKRVFPNIDVFVLKVVNKFFGESVTVSGLLTGRDIQAALQEAGQSQRLGSRVIIPQNALRNGENLFLDDVTVEELEKALGLPVIAGEPTGSGLLAAILACAEDMRNE